MREELVDNQSEALLKKAAWYLEPGNFYHFCVDILDRDLEKQPHEEMCSVAEHLIETFRRYYVEKYIPELGEKIHYLCLSPRGTFKSTVWNQCLGIFLAIKYPNIRILIDSETVTKAEVFLGDIRDHFESNQKLIALYGDLVNKDSWNNSVLLLNSRTRRGLREDTFMSSGVGKSMPGMHYDLIIGDDYVSDQNTGTFEAREKVKNHIRRAKSLLDPGAPHFMLGTRWTFSDPYAWIMAELAASHHFYVRSCGGSLDGDRPLYFPNRLTNGFLQALKVEQGSYVFSCQYRNFPIPEGEQTFDINQYKVIGKESFLHMLKGIPFRWYYLVDPALTESQVRRGDYTAMSPYVITADGNRYLYKAKAVKEGAGTIMKTIYNHYVSIKKDLGPSYNGRAYIEGIAFQKLFIPLLKDIEKDFSTKIHWVEMKTENATSKEVRIRSAVPYLEDGCLYLVEDTKRPNPTIAHVTGANLILTDQAMQFPMGANDDLIDNQGFMTQIVKKPSHNEEPPIKLGWDFEMGETRREDSGKLKRQAYRPAEEGGNDEPYNPNDYDWDVY